MSVEPAQRPSPGTPDRAPEVLRARNLPVPGPGPLVPDRPVINRRGEQGQGGYGPRTDKRVERHPLGHPAAGWGAAMSVSKVLITERELFRGPLTIKDLNQPAGFDCPGCAWPDDTGHLKLDFCENGVKHVAWEITDKKVGPDFFARHSVSELEQWTDFELEDQGRLTDPMVYDAATDHYVPISWDAAFAMIGEELRALPGPDYASFYTSGRLGNEATFLYQLFAREFGTNNLPDCSNMCHEASGRALSASLGTGKGTADLDDWYEVDALFVMGVNAASNAPRMLTALKDAYDRGAQIVHVNTLHEAATRGTIIPHEIPAMATFHSTPTSTLNLQVRPGGDMALLRGIAKVVFERSETDPGVLDADFCRRYTHGVEEYRRLVEATDWTTIERQSGLEEAAIRRVAEIYLTSGKTVISWCLGVSQHEHGVDTVREIVNLLLLRGNLGRPGTGPSPVRGHSNVQGNRTCGIDHHPNEENLARIDAACGITSPRAAGYDTVKTVQAMHAGEIGVFVGMGGNFVMAAPDTEYTKAGMRRVGMTVQVSTKLNRSHLVHGRKALILPCLGRTERDIQAGGLQSQSVEDSMSMVHLTKGGRTPASRNLLSEPDIIARMAAAALPASHTPWAWYVEDYDRIRDTMAKALPGFEDFNTKVRWRKGFRIPQPARELGFRTPSGFAEFSHAPLPEVVPEDPDMLVLQTMRSHDQWNTSIYSDDDRYRGIENLRTLVFMHADDMAARGIAEGQLVDITAVSKTGVVRRLDRYRALAYDTPRGSAAGYMPEMNVLIGIEDYSEQSDQPLMKNLRVYITPSEVTVPA